MAILDLISQVHLPSSVTLLPKYLKHFTFSSCFWSIVIVIGDGCLEILITFVFSTFISMPQYLPVSINLSIMPCSTVSSLAINTRSSAYFTVWIICRPMLKSPSPSRASLVRHSLYKLNRIGDKQHPCRTPLPICTLLVSPWSSRTLTFCSMYSLLIKYTLYLTIRTYTQFGRAPDLPECYCCLSPGLSVLNAILWICVLLCISGF